MSAFKQLQQRLSGLQCLKYLLSGPLQKMFTDPKTLAQGGLLYLLLVVRQVRFSMGSDHHSLHWVPWMFILWLVVPMFCYWFPFIWRNLDFPFHPSLPFLSFYLVLCYPKALSWKESRGRTQAIDPMSLLVELIAQISDFVVLTGPVSIWTGFSVGHQ